MTKVVVFDVRGSVAHFRRPDTLGTHATYPFITRTSLRGLVASILGRTSLPPEVRAGIRLLNPVQTVAQELSLHGKTWEAGSGRPDSFHRPTSIELVVEPHYRIYYSGPLVDELSDNLRAQRSHYHTYLGSAFCLTFPEWKSDMDVSSVESSNSKPIECVSAIPLDAVARLLPEQDRQYARVGGLLWDHEGEMHERRFRGRAIAVVYEVNGKSIRFQAAQITQESYWVLYDIVDEGTVCLW